MYAFVKLADKFARRKTKHINPRLSGLMLMSDENRLPDPSVLIPGLPSGTIIVIRAFDRKRKEELIKANKALCKKHKLLLFVSDDVSLAVKYRIDGIHFPEKTHRHGLKCLQANASIKRKFLLSAACHSKKAIFSAAKMKADIATLSPIFQTKSHLNAKSLGIQRSRLMLKETKLPIYALGGVSNKNIKALQKSDFAGIAGITLFI